MFKLDATNKNSRKVNLIIWLPIIAIEVYLFTTLLIFRFGPWQYPNQFDMRIIILVSIYHIFLFVGYFTGNVIYFRPSKKIVKWEAILKASLIINIMFVIPTTYARSGKLLPDIYLGLTDPGTAYASALNISGSSLSTLFEYTRMFFASILYAYFPLFVFFWNKLSKSSKLLSIFVILSTIAIYISTGTNKAIIEFAILIPLIFVISFISLGWRFNFKKHSLVSLVSILIIFFAGNFFSNAIQSRAGSGAKSGYFPPGHTRVNFDNGLVRFLPSSTQIGILGLSNYMTQGYYALGMALDEEFEPMYGFSSSTFISRQVSRLFEYKRFEDQSYPAKLEKYGWDRYNYWSTIYLWIASDVSFYGVSIFCLFFGFIFVTIWRDVVLFRLPFAVIFLSINLIAVFYFSANNQIGQSGESLVAYVSLLIIWLINRSRVSLKIFGEYKI